MVGPCPGSPQPPAPPPKSCPAPPPCHQPGESSETVPGALARAGLTLRWALPQVGRAADVGPRRPALPRGWSQAPEAPVSPFCRGRRGPSRGCRVRQGGLWRSAPPGRRGRGRRRGALCRARAESWGSQPRFVLVRPCPPPWAGPWGRRRGLRPHRPPRSFVGRKGARRPLGGGAGKPEPWPVPSPRCLPCHCAASHPRSPRPPLTVPLASVPRSLLASTRFRCGDGGRGHLVPVTLRPDGGRDPSRGLSWVGSGAESAGTSPPCWTGLPATHQAAGRGARDEEAPVVRADPAFAGEDGGLRGPSGLRPELCRPGRLWGRHLGPAPAWPPALRSRRSSTASPGPGPAPGTTAFAQSVCEAGAGPEPACTDGTAPSSRNQLIKGQVLALKRGHSKRAGVPRPRLACPAARSPGGLQWGGGRPGRAAGEGRAGCRGGPGRAGPDAGQACSMSG